MVAGGGAITLTATMVALSLMFTGDAFIPAAKFALISHLPILAIEAFLTGAAVLLIQRVKPTFFQHPLNHA